MTSSDYIYRSSGGGVFEPDVKAICSTGNSDLNTVINSGSKTYFEKGFSKFERSGQDVMARASQIVQ